MMHWCIRPQIVELILINDLIVYDKKRKELTGAVLLLTSYTNYT